MSRPFRSPEDVIVYGDNDRDRFRLLAAISGFHLAFDHWHQPTMPLSGCGGSRYRGEKGELGEMPESTRLSVGRTRGEWGRIWPGS